MANEYQAQHIRAETEVPASIGMGAVSPYTHATRLGSVVVNRGGEFTLKLYDGQPIQGNSAPLAEIHAPETGMQFSYHCVLGRGLWYELKRIKDNSSTFFSVTITYADISLQH